MPTFLETRTTIRQEVGRQTGLMMGTYTDTGGSQSVVVAEDLLLRNVDVGRGMSFYFTSGSLAAQSYTAVSTAAFVTGTGSLLYPHKAFGASPSGGAFEVWRSVSALDVNTMIDDAIRYASRRYLERKEDYSLQLGDPLRHWGSFERWPSGASAAPSGWTLSTEASETVAREATIIYSGKYSAVVTNTASNTAYLESDNIKGFPDLAGETVNVKALVYTNTASRARVQLLDGITTHNSGYAAGTGGWEELTVDAVVVNADPTQLKVRLTTDTGASIAVYWGKVWLEFDKKVYDFDLPADVLDGTGDETAFASISEVWAESLTTPGEFTTKLPNECWSIDSDSSTRRIIFNKSWTDQFITAGRTLKLVGQRHARKPNADTDNLEVDPSFVVAYTKSRLYDGLEWDDIDRSKRDRWAREAEQRLLDMTTPYYPDSIVIEV